MFADEARKRQATSTGGAHPRLKELIPEAGRQARDDAAKATHVNPHYVTDAKRIQEVAPDKGAQTIVPALEKLAKERQRERGNAVAVQHIRVQAEVGKELAGMELNKGGRPKKTSDIVSPVSTLAEILNLAADTAKQRSSRWQAIYRLSLEYVGAVITGVRKRS